MRNTILVGDNRQTMRQIPAGIVQSIITSPPYWGLRDYGTGTWEGGDPGCDHSPEKRGGRFATPVSSKQASNAGSNGSGVSRDCPCGATRIDDQIGQEETPEQYVATMVDVFSEAKRILHPSGTLWLNLGDTYAANRGYQVPDNKHVDVGNSGGMKVPEGYKAKDLLGIPFRVAFALQADGWFLRSIIPWVKRNPMPESTGDRPSGAVEYIFLLAKSPRYFYDAEAVRVDFADERNGNSGAYDRTRSADKGAGNPRQDLNLGKGWNEDGEISGRQRRNSDWFWESWQGLYSEEPGEPLAMVVNTHPYREAHFATFPPRLVLPCIQAGTPEAGCCSKCGEPWRRIVEHTAGDTEASERPKQTAGMASSTSTLSLSGNGSDEWAKRGGKTKTLGWEPGCDCKAERQPAIVFDPFLGSGTTAQVARWLGRHWLGCELNEAYGDMATTRIEKSPFPSAGHKPESKRKPDADQRRLMF